MQRTAGRHRAPFKLAFSMQLPGGDGPSLTAMHFAPSTSCEIPSRALKPLTGAPLSVGRHLGPVVWWRCCDRSNFFHPYTVCKFGRTLFLSTCDLSITIRHSTRKVHASYARTSLHFAIKSNLFASFIVFVLFWLSLCLSHAPSTQPSPVGTYGDR